MKQFASAAARNKDPILEVLKRTLQQHFGGEGPAQLKVLEVSSGTGQHCVHFACHLPGMTLLPSEFDQQSLASVAAYVKEANLPNLLPPVRIDASSPSNTWPLDSLPPPLDALLSINMIHITPWECTEGLLRAAGQLLKAGGLLVTYGPYAFDGVITPESNIKFNQSLKERDASWGLRDVTAIRSLAEQCGLQFEESVAMPANNHCLVFIKR